MANNYDHSEEALMVYPCACGETLHLYPGMIIGCCIAKGWEKELPEEEKEGGEGDV